MPSRRRRVHAPRGPPDSRATITHTTQSHSTTAPSHTHSNRVLEIEFGKQTTLPCQFSANCTVCDYCVPSFYINVPCVGPLEVPRRPLGADSLTLRYGRPPSQQSHTVMRSNLKEPRTAPSWRCDLCIQALCAATGVRAKPKPLTPLLQLVRAQDAVPDDQRNKPYL